MPYKLYTDKNENFECEVAVKNASLKGSMARLMLETTNGVNFVFKGKIEGGKCNIPIRRLRGLLDENSQGKICLEIIVEDVYFKPWEDDFVVEEHTSVKVKVAEQKSPIGKPILEVKFPTKMKKLIPEQKGIVPIYELIKLCEKFKINRLTLPNNKKNFTQLINEYFKSNPEFKKYKVTILNGLKHFLK